MRGAWFDIKAGSALGLLFWATMIMGIWGFFFGNKDLNSGWLGFYGIVVGGKTVHSIGMARRTGGENES